ncbi:MAG: hypothetical protein H8D87_13500 [Deltaproteobacteria bacterium]|uniref:hypothetical protein n=1 Tax=Desulfobacula sp. TaxID=2593537 RepID=UPI0019A41F04|nr:hypothetical protein [Candidatus Desulfobacula maris]MBL6992801.1 hypothetical protein [Desulfobacula sp.]MBU0464895.1 hypothetical protein [Pseudomonadota bacterium]
MAQIAEIKKKIENLPKQEYDVLRQWFAEKDSEAWDTQIIEDSRSGKLDFLVKEALQDKNNDNLKAL